MLLVAWHGWHLVCKLSCFDSSQKFVFMRSSLKWSNSSKNGSINHSWKTMRELMTTNRHTSLTVSNEQKHYLLQKPNQNWKKVILHTTRHFCVLCSMTCAQFCTILPQQRLCTCVIIGRETTTAFLWQWHPGQSADKNCSWSSRVQSVWPCDVECSAVRTEYCYCVPRHFWQKKLKTCLFESSYSERIRWHWLFILRYTNAHIDWLIMCI